MWGVVDTHLSLEEYWETLQISECAGYGIRGAPAAVTGGRCGDYWNQDSRYFMTFAIAKAEARLAEPRWLGWPIRRQYFDREYIYSPLVDLGVRWVRCIGEHRLTTIADVSLELSAGGVINDPVTFTVEFPYDENELLILYPEQERYTIRPSSVEVSDGIATVQIPRCRLLSPEFFINYQSDGDRPLYSDDGNFLSTVTVARDYCSPPGGELIWSGRSTCSPASAACEEIRQYACGALNQELGLASFEPVAVYPDGSYAPASPVVGRAPDRVRVKFVAGYSDRYDVIPPDLTRAIIALAHANLPEDYCTCSTQRRYYKRDCSPIEPAVQLGLGPSTWGVNEALQIVLERRAVSGGFI